MATIFTVNGTGSRGPDDPGQYPVQVANALIVHEWQRFAAKLDGRRNLEPWKWFAVDYPAIVFPMGSSVDTGVANCVAAIGFTPGPFALAGYSQGAVVTSHVWRDHILNPNGELHGRYVAGDFLGAVNWGNPCRAPGIARGNVYAEWAVPSGGGIAGSGRTSVASGPLGGLLPAGGGTGIGDILKDVGLGHLSPSGGLLKDAGLQLPGGGAPLGSLGGILGGLGGLLTPHTVGDRAGNDDLTTAETPDNWLDFANPNDLYTDCPDGAAGHDENLIYQIVMSRSVLGGFEAVIAMMLDAAEQFTRPVQAVTGMAEAIYNGMRFAAAGPSAGHYTYDIRPAIRWLAELAVAKALAS